MDLVVGLVDDDRLLPIGHQRLEDVVGRRRNALQLLGLQNVPIG
jgi:hypothetical protein